MASKYESYDHTSASVVLTAGYTNSSSSSSLPPSGDASTATATATAEPVVVYTTQPPATVVVYPNSQPLPSTNLLAPGQNPRPLKGHWKDGVFGCFTNLYPSCFCALYFHGAYIIAQMSQKVGFWSFKFIIISTIILWIMCIIFEILYPDANNIVWIPPFYAWILAILLRLHIVQKEKILTNGGCLPELCIGCLCFPCSVTQMARHIYGYTKVFDGDGEIDRPDNPAMAV